MYKVTLYDRGSYPSNGQVLLDTSSGDNLGVTESKYEGKLNEAGSFTFSIVPSHPLYDSIEPLCTFVSVEEDGIETFYGRVLMEKTNRITGVKQVTCEGALAFLLDVEMGEDSDELSMSASDYFNRCVNLFRTALYDSQAGTYENARLIAIGTVNVSGVSATAKFKNGSRTQIQSVMKSKLLNVYDGFFRIRRSGTTHYLDWVTQVGDTNPQSIRIKQNVVSHATTRSGEDVFTMLWPKGNSKSGGGNVEIAPIALSNEMVAKYGVIIRTVNFDADDEATLRTKALAHIAKIQDRLSLSGEINFVDMSYQDGTKPKVHIGDVFTNIDGFEGTKFTAATISKDLLDPKNDKLSLKTDKDLMSSSGSNGTNSTSSSGGGSGSGGGRGLSGAGSKWYKFIHETEEDLSLAARNIEITAEEKIRLVSQTVETHASQISTLSTDMGTVQGKWTTFEGTAIYQNRDQIATVAGKFRTDNYGRLILEEGTQFVVSGDGTSTNVGQLILLDDNTVRDVGQIVAHYQGSYSYQHDNEIAGIVGRYEVETYIDPQNPWKAVTPASDANPKELGYYEQTGPNTWAKTNDETVDPNKTYYIPNDIKKVTFDSGGGYKLKENGVEYGVYTKVGDSAELTGGIIVDKLNDGSTTTKIKGSRVIIGNALTDDDLSTWAVHAKNGTGVFAKYLEVKTLTAQEIETMLANIGDAAIDELDVIGDVTVGGSLYVDVEGQPEKVNVIDAIVNGNTLTIYKANGTHFDFSKATTLRSGGWSGSGHVFTVEANPQGNIYTIGLDNGTSSNTNLVTGVGDLTVSFTNGTPYLNIPITVTQVYSGEGDDDDLRYTRTPIVKNAGDLLLNLTGANKITQNGTISLTSLPAGKMGYGNIEIDVATSNITGLAVDTTNHQVKTSTSATAQSVTISSGEMTEAYVAAQKHYAYVLPINATIGNNTSVIASASGTIDASEAYAAGKEDATLTVDGWSSGHLKVSNTDNSDTNVDMQLSSMILTENSLTWSNNIGSGTQPIRVSMSTNGGSSSTSMTGATVQLSISINALLQQSKINIPINSSPWENGARSFSTSTTQMAHPDPDAQVYISLSAGTVTRSSYTLRAPILDGSTATGLTVSINTTPYTSQKTITKNGSFAAISDNKIGYRNVTVNVPVKLNTSYTPAGSSTPINAVVPSTDGTGDPYLRVYGVVGNLTSEDADGERSIDIKVGTTTVETATLTDYGDGYTAGNTAGYNSAKGTYTTTGGVLRVSKTNAGSSFPLSFAIDAGISYDSTTHKYTATALCDETQMDSVESGTEAYVAGQDDLIAAGGAVTKTVNNTWTLNQYVTTLTVNVPGSSITGLAVDTTNHQIKTSTSETAQSITISAGTMTKSYVSAQRHYAYVLPINAGSSVIASASGTIDASAAYNEGWDRGGATAWPRTTGSQVGTYVWHLPPGQYLVPGYSDHNGADKSRTDYSWYIPTAWLESSGSSGPSGASNQGVLDYDTCYFIRYKGPGGASTGDYVGAYWRTPPDNGGGGGSHNISIGTAWTTDRALSGWTRLNDLRNKYEAARSDSEYVAFEVSCGGTSKVYYMEP